MAYTHTTWSELKAQLAARLDDSASVFWSDEELGLYLAEAMRAFGLLSAFWREQGTVSVSAGTVFYDIFSGYVNGATESSLAPTITDRDIIRQLQYALLESAASQTVWGGTDQFTYSDLVSAIQRRRNQFLSDTGIVVTRSVVAGPADSTGRITLSDSVIDVRRTAWITSLGYHVPLWRDDERMQTAANQYWNVADDEAPYSYTIMASPPVTLQLAAVPTASSGTVELLTVNAGPALTPDAAATVLGIPDPLSAAIKWGALADLLGKDGPSRDAPRAAASEQVYQLYVRAARMLPVIVQARIGSTPVIGCTISEADAKNPQWEDQPGSMANIAMAGSNLMAAVPLPDAAATVTLDIVRPAPIPASGGAYVQVGREQIGMLVDYAEWLALFKCAGAEWHAAEQQAQNFMVQALTYNQRLAASVRTAIISGEQSQREKRVTKRRETAAKQGLGAMVTE